MLLYSSPAEPANQTVHGIEQGMRSYRTVVQERKQHMHVLMQQQGILRLQSTQRGSATLIHLPIAGDVQEDSDLAHGQIRAPAHPGYSKRPRQWLGTERPTIELVREDLGLRLHANFVGDINEQSFIYKPPARLIDAFNANSFVRRFW